MLAHLYPAKLVRAQTLREDIAALMEVSVEHVDAHVSDILSGSSEVLQILARISEIIQAKPHVLVAYAWVLYMALFSGGRYIRASLANAAGSGASFWARNPSPVRTSHAVYSGARVASLPSLPIGDDIGAFTGTGDSKTSAAMPLNRIPVRRSSRAHAQCVSDFTLGNKIENQGIGLSLFHFPGEEDGEDLKREFKARLLDVEILLQEQEKLDIVQESVKIFEDLHALVEILDELCALDKPILRDRSGISEAEDTQARKLQSTEDDDLDDDSDEGLSGPETEISSVSSTPLRGSIGGIRIVSTRSLPEARNSLALAQERNKKTHGRTSSPSRHTTNLDTSRRGLTLKTVKGHIDKLVRFNLGPPLTGSHNRYFGVRSNSSITDVTYGKHGLLAVGACFLLFLWAFTGLAIWLR